MLFYVSIRTRAAVFFISAIETEAHHPVEGIANNMFQAETGGQCAASQPFFQRAAEPDSTTENGASDAINGSGDVLEEQLYYLGSITQNIPDAVVAMDNKYCIRGWNKAAETLFGWQRAEVLGKLAFDILPTTFPNNLDGRVEWQVALVTEGHWQGEII